MTVVEQWNWNYISILKDNIYFYQLLSFQKWKEKKLPGTSSTVKAISDFLVTVYKFYPRRTVPAIKDWTLILIIQGLNEEKNHTYRLLAHCQGTKGKRIRKTRANSLALISLWSFLKREKRHSELFTGNLVVSACGHNQEASHNAQFSLFEIFLFLHSYSTL